MIRSISKVNYKLSRRSEKGSIGKCRYSPEGMSDEELEFLSTFVHTYHPETVTETERYGCGQILRKYCWYPKKWPLRMRNFHGPSQWDHVTQHLLEAREKFIGLYSKRLKNDFDEKTGRKSYVIQAPFWVYAKNKKIKSDNAKGTLFFPSHSTFWCDIESDTKDIISFLKKLPSEMQPISVCLFFVDIQKGRHKIYKEAGFAVYTAGSWDNQWFAHNFFEIAKYFKYSLSNSLGSQLFYCTAIGVESFIIDFKPTVLTNTDTNILSSAIPIAEHKQVKKAYAMFDFKVQKDSATRLEFAKQELGVYDGISLFRQSYMMYVSQVSAIVSKSKKRVKEMIKKIIKKILRIKPVAQKINPYNFGAGYNVDEQEDVLVVNDTSSKLKFTLRKKGSDVDVFRQVIVRKEYDIIFDLFKSNNYTPKYIIDLGGNIGLTSAQLMYNYPEATIVSLEPDKDNLELLKVNAPGVKGIQKAVWSSHTKLTINREFRDGQDWSIQTVPSQEGDSNKVDTITVDALMKEFDFPRIDFLKIDIEGAEVELLASEYQPDFLEKVVVIAIEIHDEFNIRTAVYTKLKSYGFLVFNSGELTIGLNKKLLK